MTSRTPWRPLAAGMAQQLVENDDAITPGWVDAFRTVPRHVFVPRIIDFDGRRYRVLTERTHAREWLDHAYSDTSLVTQDLPHGAGYRLPGGDPLAVPTSSSTTPGLMARMLEALDLHPGMSVLKIGTGTGYNAALLSTRVGADRVTSVDIDAELVRQARGRLDALGLRPHLVVADGRDGCPGRAPFDRIIATAGVPDVPAAWREQLAPGGRLLANLRGELSAGTLCLLTRSGTEAEVIGPVLPLGGHFMWLRPDATDPHAHHERQEEVRRLPELRGVTTLDPSALPIEDDDFRHLLQLHIQGLRSVSRGTAPHPGEQVDRSAVLVRSGDGASASAFTAPDGHGRHHVVQSGPRHLWDQVESAYRLFEDLGRPGPGRFGVVAGPRSSFMWLDSDDGWNRWPLPLV